jgi:Tol biopolymer transport system component
VALSSGTRLGVYEVTGQIGAGGMGEVYRATDTKLKRQVAIKILPPALAGDVDRLARFQREAEVLASLNHPHIAGIYGLEEGGGTTALVMELVEGEDLSQRIAKGAIPLDEALPIARQIADALEAAHEQGIIHRDLKPANIKLRADGTVKVLDFGLAKVAGPPEGGHYVPPGVSMSPTMVSPAMMSGAGVILGTAAYMAPEQAKGRAVDRRADIWAFGVVLHEMLTGQQLFTADTIPETLAHVMTRATDLGGLPAATPPRVRGLIARCLEKDPKKRLRDIGEARLILDDPAPLSEATRAVPSALAQSRLARTVPWVAAGLATVLLAALALVHFLEPVPQPAEVRFQVPFPGTGTLKGFSVSPNGRLIAYTSNDDGPLQIYVRPLDSLAARALPGTEGPRFIFWSHDSEHIGFFADGKLKRVGLNGQPPQTLAASADSRGGTWSPAGVILFASGPNGPLYQIPDTGGTPTPATEAPPQGEGFRYPAFLPDGDHFLFYRASDAPDVAGVYAGSLQRIEPVRILPDVGNVAYVSAGNGEGGTIFFKREGALMAQAFDPTSLRTSGGTLSIADQIPFGFGNIAWAQLAAVPGVLAYVSDAAQNLADLVWLDRAGSTSVVVRGVGGVSNLSPDGTRVSFFRRDPRSTAQDPDLWVEDLTRGGTVRLTMTSSFNSVWSPDSKRVVYAFRPQTGRTSFYVVPATGAATPALLLEAAGQNARLEDWSRDGRWIVYSTNNDGSGDLMLLPTEGNRKPVVYLSKSSFRRSNAQFSPDGLWMAYQSDESGRSEVYVQAVPASTEKVTISSGGGGGPRWRHDGRELYYAAPGGKLMGVAVKTGATFEAGVPRQILDGIGGAAYAPSRDGQRFLIVQPRAEAAAPITVVLNWRPGLGK